MYCDQPLIAATLVAELVVESCAERINTFDSRLNDLEEAMGQHEYINRPLGNPLQLDDLGFITTTRRLNFISRMLGLDTARLEGVRLALNKILDETKNITKEISVGSGGPESIAALTAASNSSYMIDEIVAYLLNSCQHLLLRVEYETKRTQTQIAVVRLFPSDLR